MPAEEINPDITLDLRSLRCPHLLITTIQAIEKSLPGQILCVLASDLNAPSSIGSWTRQSGHVLLEMGQEGEDFVFYIQRQPVKMPLEVDN